MSRVRLVLFWLVLAVYVAIVAAVLTTSPLVRLDWRIMFFQPAVQWPQIHAYLDYFIVLGQRGPAAITVGAWLVWRTWQQRTTRPLLILVIALLLLNATVGAAKYGLARRGPHYATVIGSSELFGPMSSKDIFPSGHTANAVVTWGVLAYLATTPAARRLGAVLSALLALGIGMTTIYLGTHWLSDVLSGWCAGLLVLLALPWFEPFAARTEAWLHSRWPQRHRRLSPAPLVPSPTAVRAVIIRQRDAPEDPSDLLRPAGATGGSGTPDA